MWMIIIIEYNQWDAVWKCTFCTNTWKMPMTETIAAIWRPMKMFLQESINIIKVPMKMLKNFMEILKDSER